MPKRVVQMDAVGRREGDGDRRKRRYHLGPGGGERLCSPCSDIRRAPPSWVRELHLDAAADSGAGPVRRGGERERSWSGPRASSGSRRRDRHRSRSTRPAARRGRSLFTLGLAYEFGPSAPLPDSDPLPMLVKARGCKLPAAPLQVIGELHANVAS